MWFRRKSPEPQSDVVHALRRQLMELDERIADLEQKHIRLRGKVYAHKLHLEETPAAADSKPESKAELLRRAGFTPGKPMLHKEG